MGREGEEEGSYRALTSRAPQGTAANTQQGVPPPQPKPGLRDAPALSSSPSQTLSSLSSCTSKGILEETDANNLNINPTISGTLHQAVWAEGGEKRLL